jgi:vanillate O-demethylase ferredoxin subunit
MNQLSVKVTSKTAEALDIVSIELAGADGTALPPFGAGAHIDVHLPGGLVRQYSLCNNFPAPGRYLIGVLRDPASRGGSAAVHDLLQVGTLLQISEPKNHFVLTPARHILLFAGGIGVTPILCMAERLAQSDAGFGMHYCSRSPERTAFHARIEASAFAGQVQFHFDSGAAAQKLDMAAVLAAADPATHLYVCGPGGFIEHVIDSARRAGWPAAQLHVEYFGAQPQDHGGDSAFEVKLASSGKVISVPAGKTVVAALAAHGIELPVSCEQGVCGTCITRVLEGLPDHRDKYFTEEELARNDQFTACCSRSKSALLVLDL